MSITAQAIKDQEFQSKFRGYDTIEVKAYLELIAEEFFELQEEDKRREEMHDALVTEKTDLADKCRLHEREIESLKDEKEALEAELEKEKNKIADLLEENEELQTSVADCEGEKKDLEDEVSATEARIKDAEELVEKERREKASVVSKAELLESQISEGKKEEIDFKITIGAAQRFAEEIKAKSELEAQALKEKADDDVQKFRDAASEELARIPEEISELHEQRKMVRDELKEILEKHLDGLNAFAVVRENNKDEDLDELYQKITIGDDGEISDKDRERIEQEMASDQQPGEMSDDLDNVEMDLGLPFSLDEQDDEDAS